MPKQVPSVGRVVHFVYGGQHVPAIIADPDFRMPHEQPEEDGRPVQALTVFLPAAAPFTTVAKHADEVAPGTWLHGTWHWPEHVPALPD